MLKWGEPNEKVVSKHKFAWLVTAILLILVTLLLCIIIFGWLKDFLIFGTFNFAVAKFVDATGLSVYLVKGILAVVLFPFFLALREVGKIPLFKGVGRLPKSVAWGLIIGYASTYFLAMYFATKNTYFHHSGTTLKAAKYYAITPEGVRFFDTEGFDPKYGTKLNPVTPLVIANLERMKRGDIAKPLAFKAVSEIAFFDSQTGQPKVWYARSANGTITLFSTSGFDPLSGEELKPACQQIVEEVSRRHHEAEMRLQADDAQAKVAERVAVAAEERARFDAQERAYRERYVNPYTRRIKNRKTAALLVLGDADGASTLQERLSSALKEKGLEPAEGLFKPDFLGDGSAAKFFGGDWSYVKKLRLEDYADVIVLMRVTHRTTSADAIEGLRTATLILDMKCLDVVNLRIDGSRSATVKGAGFSESEALRGSLKNATVEIHKFINSIED